jgi:peptide/nickel transport system permease protein
VNVRRYVLKKALSALLTTFLIISLNFFLFQILPGDPTRVLLPRGCQTTSNVTGSCTLRAQLIHQWGLDQPLLTRYVVYLNNLLHGQLGITITYLGGGIPISTLIANSLYQTLLLVGVATVLTMWLGIILGRISGWRRGRRSDVTITLSTLAAYSMPSFWVSLVLILVFVVEVPIFQPVLPLDFEKLDILSQIANQLWFDSLAILTFVLTNVAWFSLTLRNTLTDTLPEDYMLTARAKGLTERAQLRDHAMPNARLPVVTASALYFGWVFSGAIVVEQVFGIKGLGELTWEATRALDYPLMSAIFLVATVGVVFANVIADLLYMVLDPRIREA